MKSFATVAVIATMAAAASAQHIFPDHHETPHYEHEEEHHALSEEEHQNMFPGFTGSQQTMGQQQRGDQQQSYYMPSYNQQFQQPGPNPMTPTSHELAEPSYIYSPQVDHQVRHPMPEFEPNLEFLQSMKPPVKKLVKSPSSPMTVQRTKAAPPLTQTHPQQHAQASDDPFSQVEERLIKALMSDKKPPTSKTPSTPAPVRQATEKTIHTQSTPPPKSHPIAASPELVEQMGMEQFKPKTCWTKTKFRDVGRMVSECSAGLEHAGNLCYPICQDGYKGVSENCFSICPEGFKSNGSFCQKPKAVGRGWGSHKKCNGGQNCERWGLLWYPKCPAGYKSHGCCLCQAECPKGMGESGEQCAKKAYSRQNAHPMVCPTGKEQEGFMCYDPCGKGLEGSHNVCWGKCPAGTEQCGVLCMQHGETCTAYIASIGKDTLTSALAQNFQKGSGQMSNDLDLQTIQEEAYNNQIQGIYRPPQPTKPLSLGPGLTFPTCETFY